MTNDAVDEQFAEEESFGEYLGDVRGNAVVKLLSTLTNVNKFVNSIGLAAEAIGGKEVGVMVYLTRDKRFVSLELDLSGAIDPKPPTPEVMTKR